MGTTYTKSSTDRRTNTPARPATRSEELIYLFFVAWTLVGLCLDGWAHRYRPELESFFTPWHAVFYTGFIGAAATLAMIVIRRRPTSPSLLAAIPSGYGLAVAGLALFALGGVGDGIWHTVFGVETSLDALLSPTHLVLLVGMLAGATAPLRAAWHDADNAHSTDGLRSFVVPLLSLALATTGIAFFFLYANGFNNWPMSRSFIAENNESETRAALGVLSTQASTLILLAPLMAILHRWRPPTGTFTIMFAIVGTFMAGLDAFEFWWQIIAPVLGGVTADWIIARPDVSIRHRAWLCGALVPLVMWTTTTLTTHLAWEVLWPPELWIGNIVMAVLAGAALAYLAHPPARPATLTRER